MAVKKCNHEPSTGKPGFRVDIAPGKMVINLLLFSTCTKNILKKPRHAVI